MTELPVPAGFRTALPEAIDATGVYTVGAAVNPGFDSMAVRWSGTSFQLLGDLPGGAESSGAAGISGNGRFVVGASASANGTEAFRWSEEEGMQALGDLPGGTFMSTAAGVSDDGAIVVGSSFARYSFTPNPTADAFIWIESRGMLPLKDHLIELGATGLEDWTLLAASAISADGRVIVGTALNPQNREEAFAVIIPAPGGALILGGALVIRLSGRARPRAVQCR